MRPLPQDWKDEVAKHMMLLANTAYVNMHRENRAVEVQPMVFLSRPIPAGIEPPPPRPGQDPEQMIPVMMTTLPNELVEQMFQFRQFGALTQIVRNALTDETLPWQFGTPGPAELVLVLTETWMISGDTKEAVENARDEYGSLEYHPDAKSALMLTTYTLTGQEIWSQEVKDGELIGEWKRLAVSSEAEGNMILNPAQFH